MMFAFGMWVGLTIGVFFGALLAALLKGGAREDEAMDVATMQAELDRVQAELARKIASLDHLVSYAKHERQLRREAERRHRPQITDWRGEKPIGPTAQTAPHPRGALREPWPQWWKDDGTPGDRDG